MPKAAEPLTESLINTPDEEYQLLLRSLRRRKGFGLLFVESTPVGGFDLIKKVSFDLQKKKINVLVLGKAINNLIELIEVFPGQENLNILFRACRIKLKALSKKG